MLSRRILLLASRSIRHTALRPLMVVAQPNTQILLQKAASMINSELKDCSLQSFQNLKVAFKPSTSFPSPMDQQPLLYLNFLLQRTEAYQDDDIKVFYNLVDIGDFHEPVLQELIEMFDHSQSSEPTLSSEILLDFSFLCSRVYKIFLETKSYKKTVITLLNEEKEKYFFEQKAFTRKLSKRLGEYEKDRHIQNLISSSSSCDSKVMERLFPFGQFELLHDVENANLLRIIGKLVGKHKIENDEFNHLASEIEMHLLNNPDVLHKPIPRHLIHQALAELKKVGTYGWNDYVLITLAKRGIFPRRMNFGEGVRLKQENICVHYMKKEPRLLDEDYRREILSKCSENSWFHLSELIQKEWS